MIKNNLFVQAIGKFLLGVILIGLLLFLPAGSLGYWQGWLLMGILFVPMFCAGLVMMSKNPELLRKRRRWYLLRPFLSLLCCFIFR